MTPFKRELLVVAVLALVALGVAWQAPGPISVDIGPPDEIYLTAFEGPESNPSRDYRWSTQDSDLHFPGLGVGDWQVTLVAAAGARPHGPVPLTIRVGGEPVLSVPAADPDFHSYTFRVPARALPSGDLQLDLAIAAYRPPGENRDLALAVDRVTLDPVGLHLPAPLTLLWLTGALILLYATARMAWSLRGAGALTVVVALLLSGLIAAARLLVTPYASYLALFAALAYGGVYTLRATLRRYGPYPPTPFPTEEGRADRPIEEGEVSVLLPSLCRGGVGGEVGDEVGGRQVSARASWLALVAALLVAGGLAWFGYYQHFAAAQLHTLGEIRIERAVQAQLHGWSIKTGGEVNDASLGLRQRILTDRAQWLPAVAQDFAAEAWAYFHTLPLVLAPLGLWVACRPRRPADPTAAAQRRMLAAAGVWAAVGVAYAIIGAAANLYVRYPLFLAPLVALGSGLFLSALWDRGRGGRLLAALFLAATVVEGLLFWYGRILYANK